MNSGLRRLIVDLMGLMALMLSGTLAAAQDLSSDSQDLQSSSNVGFEGSPVSRIDIAVRPSEDPAQIRALIRQEPGKPLSMDAIRQQRGRAAADWQVYAGAGEPGAAGHRASRAVYPATRLQRGTHFLSGSHEDFSVHAPAAGCECSVDFVVRARLCFRRRATPFGVLCFRRIFRSAAYTRARKPTISTGL